MYAALTQRLSLSVIIASTLCHAKNRTNPATIHQTIQTCSVLSFPPRDICSAAGKLFGVSRGTPSRLGVPGRLGGKREVLARSVELGRVGRIVDVAWTLRVPPKLGDEERLPCSGAASTMLVMLGCQRFATKSAFAMFVKCVRDQHKQAAIFMAFER